MIDPSAVEVRRPDFGQRHAQHLQNVCHRFRRRRVAGNPAPAVMPGQQRPK